MTGFSADWLALREPYDRAARNTAVLDAVAAAFAAASSVAVTDLGCGTGATMRAMAPRLPAGQSWTLVDNDAVLLQDVLRDGTAAVPAGTRVTTAEADLAGHSAGAIDAMLGDCDLVATSALLDLVSAAWLGRLVDSLARLSRPFYAALSYDGEVVLSPECPDDNEVIAAVNRHQRTDKGFGAALGPDAARLAPERLRGAGFTIVEGRSDWRFGPDDRDIQLAMIADWATAAREIGVDGKILSSWLVDRGDLVVAGRSRMRVGHIDFFAAPPHRVHP